VARMIQAPIFHVNGDDPEAVVRVARLAFEYRQAFNKDVVIDLVCYRRRGHNEGDDPSMTNPLMYAIIDTKRSVRKIYTEELMGRGDITLEEAEETLRDYQQQLETVFKATRDSSSGPSTRITRLREPEPEPDVETAIDAGVLKRIGEAHVNPPEGFTPHKRVAQRLERRPRMAVEGASEWGQRTAVTLLLPHSHEGQGPDHTSGRLERYLQLCAEDNMRVAVPTTPANHFHLLRRQALSPKKKPLVVFTPKSLLRNRLCVS